MENKIAVCAYCTKSLNGQPQYHRHFNIFCDETCATMFDYSDCLPIPPDAILHVPEMVFKKKEVRHE